MTTYVVQLGEVIERPQWEGPASPEHNKGVVRRAYGSMSEGRDTFLAEHDEIYSQDLVAHFPGMPPIDITMHRAFGLANYDAFSDLTRSVEDLVADGDKVVARWTTVGRHTGDFQGVPPTGKTLTTSGITIFRFEDGYIAEEWIESDMLGLIQQVGALPQPGDA